MGSLTLGVNTLYRVFCFFKLFIIGGKGLKAASFMSRLWMVHRVPGELMGCLLELQLREIVRFV